MNRDDSLGAGPFRIVRSGQDNLNVVFRRRGSIGVESCGFGNFDVAFVGHVKPRDIGGRVGRAFERRVDSVARFIFRNVNGKVNGRECSGVITNEGRGVERLGAVVGVNLIGIGFADIDSVNGYV